ncbi:hypothetical protein PN450_19905 [Dolichospermum lemmermannii CS-548]|nr:hypothetical protein [Dolichospermum lemmermannii]MDB9439008.1 hypothetical protein [Dolichospermum lemmermannii CS-548]
MLDQAIISIPGIVEIEETQERSLIAKYLNMWMLTYTYLVNRLY